MKTIKFFYKNGKTLVRRCHDIEEDENCWRVSFPTPGGMPELVIFQKNEQIEKIEVITKNGKYDHNIKSYINEKIKRGEKKILLRFYLTTNVKKELYNDLINFLEKNKIIYTEISDNKTEAFIDIKLDGRNTYVKKVKQSYKKEGK